jgi:hypothetical protein
MMDFLASVEQSGFCTWIRQSLFAYPFVLFLHTVGLAMVSGVNAAIDLRILGFASRMRLSPMERFFPFMWAGFAINAASGVLLLAANATTKVVSGVFWIKMVLITMAVIDMVVIRRKVFRDPLVDKRPVPSNGRMLALSSLLFWAGAITTGRLMAYIGTGALENSITDLLGR